MAIILNIDTAMELASICLSVHQEPLKFLQNANQKEHSSWLHMAMNELTNLKEWKDLEAVAVTIGPGSYTGLRVGLSAAKGLCYALAVPLLGINTLEMMANAVKGEVSEWSRPLIDARRMEVFTAMYDKDLNEKSAASAMVLTADSFADELSSGKIVFSGSGSTKLRSIINHPNAVFSDTIATAANMSSLSETYFKEKKWADLAYTEPFYLKEFFTPPKTNGLS